MNKIIKVLLLIGFVTPLFNSGNIITFDGEVITGNRLPKFGVLCETAHVHPAPTEDTAPLYDIPRGTRLRIIEQSRGGLRNYAMIKTGEWVILSSFCFNKYQ